MGEELLRALSGKVHWLLQVEDGREQMRSNPAHTAFLSGKDRHLQPYTALFMPHESRVWVLWTFYLPDWTNP